MGFEKIYGAKERHDGLTEIGRSKYEVRFSYGQDGENGYDYRKQYRYIPTLEEIKNEIISLINSTVDNNILQGYQYSGKLVWLSSENQFNYKAIYDIAVQTSGENLPTTVKLGTDESPEYVTFNTLDEMKEFVTGFISHIQNALQEGWKEKDSIDWSLYTLKNT